MLKDDERYNGDFLYGGLGTLNPYDGIPYPEIPTNCIACLAMLRQGKWHSLPVGFGENVQMIHSPEGEVPICSGHRKK